MLSAGESLRFKTVIESTINALEIAQTQHKRNMRQSPTNKRTRSQPSYLSDARMVDKRLDGIIDLFEATADELEHKQSWNTLQSFINSKVEIKEKTQNLLRQVCDTMERKKKIEREIIIERREFKKQEAIMLRNVNILQKRFNALVRDSAEDLQYETAICSAERASLKTLFNDRIRAEERENNDLNKTINNEEMIHSHSLKYLDQHNQFMIESIRNQNEMKIEEMEYAEQMIFDLQQSLDNITNHYNKINDKVVSFERKKKEQQMNTKLINEKQEQLQIEKTQQITAHVFQKIVQKFNKKKPKGKKKTKAKKAKKKKKKKK
eukprot:299571_1